MQNSHNVTKNDSVSSEKQKTPDKKLTASAGMFAFLTVSVLLTFTLCKFSFYLLKNHRSFVSRDDLTQTYADLKGFDADRNDFAVLSAKNEDVLTIQPPTIIRRPDESILTVSMTPPPVLPKIQRLAPADVAPVLTAAVIPDDVSETELSSLVNESAALLDETDKSLDDGKQVLTENDVSAAPAEKPADVAVLAGVETPVEPKKELPRETVVAAPVQKTIETGTHWVDMAALRRQIKEKKNVIAAKRAVPSVAEMPDTPQTAALTETSIADTAQSQTPLQAPQTKADEILKQPTVSEKETTETAKPEQKPAPAKKVEKSFASPWKVAKVNGANALNPVLTENADETETVKKVDNKKETTAKASVVPAAATEKLPSEAKAVFYQNGKIKKIITKDGQAFDPSAKPQEVPDDFFAGQEAAVWTNMSQADTPSVWSFASDGKNGKTAKAFKVANLQPPVLEDAKDVTTAKKDEKDEKTDAVKEAKPDDTKAGKEEVSPLQTALTPEATATDAKQTDEKKDVAAPAKTEAAPPSLLAGLPGTDAVPVGAKKTDSVLSDMSPKEDDLQFEPKKVADKEKTNEKSLTSKLFSMFSGDNKKEDDDKSENAAKGTVSGLATFPTGQGGVKQAEIKPLARKNVASLLKSLSEPETEEETPVPDEIRLTFKPKNADLSAASAKLIRKFSKHARENIQKRIEIRVSFEDVAVQKKRLTMIRNLLTGEGVENEQIVVLQTDRSPETIVLRVFTVKDEAYEMQSTWLNGKEERLYYKKW